MDKNKTMNLNTLIKVILGILAAYMAYSSHSAKFFESTVLGYEPNTAYNLIRILFPIPLSFWGAWVSTSVLMDLYQSNNKNRNYKIKVLGVIQNIAYSDTRINKKPLFKATLKYSDHIKVFDHIPSDLNIKFNEGDEMVIYHDENNLDNAFLDYKESIALKIK